MAARDLEAPPDDTVPRSGRDLEPPEGLSPAPQPQARTPRSWLESLVRGGIQGDTFGFSDEAMGAIQAARSRWLGEDGTNWAGYKKNYLRERDIDRAHNDQAQADHPWWNLGGQALGVLASAPIMPGGALKGLSLGQKAWLLARTAAPVGAIAGIGTSKADNLGDLGKDAVTNAAASVALPLGFSTAAERLVPLLRSAAANRSVEALGTNLGQYRKLDYQDAIQPLGTELMEKGMIPFFGNQKTIQSRVGSELQRQGPAIGDLLKALDAKAADSLSSQQRALLPAGPAQAMPGLMPVSELGLDRVPRGIWSQAGEELPASTRNVRGGALPPPPPSGTLGDLFVRPSEVRERAMSQVVDPLKKLPAIAVGSVPERLAGDVSTLSAPGDRMTLRGANDVLQGMDERLRDAYDKEGGQMTEALKQVRGILRGAQQEAAGRIDPDLADQLLAAKGSYGNMAKAKGIVDDAVRRNTANHSLSLYDMMALLTGTGGHMAAHGGPNAEALLTGAAMAGATHLVRKSGNAMAANTAWQGARALDNPLVLQLIQRYLAGAQPRAQAALLGPDESQR